MDDLTRMTPQHIPSFPVACTDHDRWQKHPTSSTLDVLWDNDFRGRRPPIILRSPGPWISLRDKDFQYASIAALLDALCYAQQLDALCYAQQHAKHYARAMQQQAKRTLGQHNPWTFIGTGSGCPATALVTTCREHCCTQNVAVIVATRLTFYARLWLRYATQSRCPALCLALCEACAMLHKCEAITRETCYGST
jgi:hypothetical protein